MPTSAFVTRTMVELSDTLVDDFDVVDLLTLLTNRCAEGFDVAAAGLMLVSPTDTQLRVLASSSETSRDLELYELQASEGPCIEAYRGGLPIGVADLSREGRRWPLFVPAALKAGVRSAYAFPLRLRGSTIGALNLFRDSTGEFPDEDRTVARAFADVATIAILQHWAMSDARLLRDQLTHALNSRVVIEQAKGMLAERAGVEVGEAFVLLRNYARPRNLKLAELAARFVAGGVPLDELSPPAAR